MDLRTARHIVGLAEYLSFTRAAGALGLTQSALSRSIQQVERSLGVRLFDRDRTKVQLTAIGRTVVDGAAQLLQQSREFEDVLDRLSRGEQSCVRFGMARTAAVALLPQVLKHEIVASPLRQSLVAVRSFDALMDLLLTREIEFFVSAEQSRPRASVLQATRIANFPMTQLVRPDHPLLHAGTQKQHDEFPWMISSTIAADSDAADLGYPHLRALPEIVLEDLGCAASLAQSTDLIWITSTFSAIRELQDGRLRQLPFPMQVRKAARAPYKLMIYQLRGRTMSPAAQHLTEQFGTLASSLQTAIGTGS